MMFLLNAAASATFSAYVILFGVGQNQDELILMIKDHHTFPTKEECLKSAADNLKDAVTNFGSIGFSMILDMDCSENGPDSKSTVPPTLKKTDNAL